MSQDPWPPQSAADELDRATARTRRRAQWPAWLFLGLTVVNFAFFVIAGSGNRALSTTLIPLPTLLAVVVLVITSRQPVVGRDAARINRPVVWAALIAAVVGLILDQTLLPHRFTWWLVLLAALMITPYLIGAYRWLRR